jgi:hypothetical protein
MSKMIAYGLQIKLRYSDGKPRPPLITAKSEKELNGYIRIYYAGISEHPNNAYKTLEDWLNCFDKVTIEMEFPDE